MVSVTISIDEETAGKIEKYSWVNWSEIAGNEIMKKGIFNRFIKTNKLSDKDWQFCDKIDWHPVDELNIKKSFKDKLIKSSKQKGKIVKSIAEEYNL